MMNEHLDFKIYIKFVSRDINTWINVNITAVAINNMELVLYSIKLDMDEIAAKISVIFRMGLFLGNKLVIFILFVTNLKKRIFILH